MLENEETAAGGQGKFALVAALLVLGLVRMILAARVGTVARRMIALMVFTPNYAAAALRLAQHPDFRQQQRLFSVVIESTVSFQHKRFNGSGSWLAREWQLMRPYRSAQIGEGWQNGFQDV